MLRANRLCRQVCKLRYHLGLAQGRSGHRFILLGHARLHRLRLGRKYRLGLLTDQLAAKSHVVIFVEHAELIQIRPHPLYFIQVLTAFVKRAHLLASRKL
jgi:hypothetical protein